MFVLMRALTYSAVFVGFLLIALPARILSAAGIGAPASFGPMQASGVALVVTGGAVVAWCLLTFVFVGRGTPAPFDAPRRLVIRGPYRYVRNPMYIGAGLALAGAAAYYQSFGLSLYAAAFLLAMHLLVVAYEEPTLEGTFGGEYRTYRMHVRRWLPVP